MRHEGRERFLAEMREITTLPYEAPQPLYEERVGEFETPGEMAYFERFTNLVGPDGEVLDLACGDGRHTLQLAARARHVVGLDQSWRSLQAARQKCAAAPNVTFMEGSMLAPAFPPATFNGVWFAQAFEYVPPDSRDALLSTLHTILKPSGILYASIETWARPRRRDSLKALWRVARLYGYWKYARGKPLLWGEFLYRLPTWDTPPRGWHYHVHTSPRVLRVLLDRHGFAPIQMELGDDCIYMLCAHRGQAGTTATASPAFKVSST
jgi:SAM-dependent methyltransferase